ncbi:helix-turn-helix domain-containing protein [Rhodanobacter terrae]|uniref:Helix-turn-helix domain-containing protein n=1 Tax=Rhodanobacter terrae TaxID=418647 RepID=A0ABW0T243_9GAMM
MGVDITPYVGTAFRLLRERTEVSQEDLAFRAGLDRTYVSGIECGRRNPSLKSMQHLAAELSVSLDQVFILARKLAGQTEKLPAQKRVRKPRAHG